MPQEDNQDISGTLLTRAELLREFRVSKAAERKFRRDRADPLPHLRFGRRILYPLKEVIAWARRRADEQQIRGSLDAECPQVVHLEDLKAHIAAGRDAGLSVVKTEHVDADHVLVFWRTT